MIRPHPARWFELLVARDDAMLALEALASTGAVELETRSGVALPTSFADLRPRLQQFAELALRYQAYWPVDGLRASAFPEPPQVALERSIACIRGWAQEAEPLIRELQQCVVEQTELLRWREVIAKLAGGLVDLAQAAAAGPHLQVRLCVYPPDCPPEWGPGLLVRSFGTEGELIALVAGTPGQQQVLAQQVAILRGQTLDLPPWLGAERTHNETELARRLDALAGRHDGARRALASLTDRHRLREALGDARRLQWVLDNVHALEAGELFCWITGWTSAPSSERLEHAIERSGARALLHLPPPPEGARAPLLLANPWWARPFEVFSRAMGMPSGDEADPSVLLAIAVPLMFGYMFGDVGQGLVIAAAGFALRRRWPMARLFIAGGLAAAVFGFLFGSVFSLHAIEPLWIAPLADPLTVLLVPLMGGAVLLTIGLLLSAVEAHWRDTLAVWMATDAGLLACYLGLIASFVWPGGLSVAAAGALLFCLGHGWREQRLSAAAAALGELVERLVQILINTLSFARVGAFALAHAGLSSAIVALMHVAGDPVLSTLVLVLGNVVVILLEGLVVSIQTTRLVLFEFFTRFLEAKGRVFRPLPLPPSNLQES